MKRVMTMLAVLLLAACAPVLNRELMREGTRNVPMDQLRDTPADYEGRLFILGGVIVNSKFTETGTQIEALYVPVDSYGYLDEGEHRGEICLAISPKSAHLLDPVVYKNGREITLAGEFLETRKGKIDDMEYVYPVFEIKQIYLWQERTYYYGPYSNPYFYNYPFMSDPWGRPYPDPYWPYTPW